MHLVQFFLVGILSALGALFLELLLGVFLSPASFDALTIPDHVNFLLVSAVLIEEGVKYTTLRTRLQALPPPKKNVLSSFAFGAGFGFTETVLIFFTAPALLYSSLVGTFTLHVLTVGWAYLFFRLSHSTTSWFIPALAFAIMASIHMGYNSLIVYNFSIETLWAYLAFWSMAFLVLSRYLRGISR